MAEGEKGKGADDGYWPETRKAIRFLIWTIVFILVGMVVLSATGIKLSLGGGG